MQWYEATSKKLEAGHRYSHQELIKLLKNNYPQMRDSSYHWAVCGMLKSGNLTKVARNVYVVQNEREKPMYRPAYSDLAAKLISQVSDKYPSVRFTVFETALMNDFLNHLVALNTVFIQAEKDVSIFVFRHLRELGYAHLLYKPKKADYALYWEKDCIVVTDMISEAPTEATEMFHILKNAENPHFYGFRLHTFRTTDKVIRYGINNQFDFAEHPAVIQRGEKRTINICVAVPAVA